MALKPRGYPWARVLIPFVWAIGFTLLALVTLPFSELGFLDKILHAGVTFGAVLLFAWGAGNKSNSTAFVVFLGVLILIYSFFIEIVQKYIPGRSLNIYDFLANFVGVILGVWVIHRGRVKNR